MILGRYLEQSREGLLILVYHRPNLVRDLQREFLRTHLRSNRKDELTCWLMSKMAISLRLVKSWKLSSIFSIDVSKYPYMRSINKMSYLHSLASTIIKFLLWSSFTCPIPARSRPVTESYINQVGTDLNYPPPTLTSSPITARRFLSFDGAEVAIQNQGVLRERRIGDLHVMSQLASLCS